MANLLFSIGHAPPFPVTRPTTGCHSLVSGASLYECDCHCHE